MLGPRASTHSPGVVSLALVLLIVGAAFAQVPSRNVNMVAGIDWPEGDPFLQRQNEPTVAVSTRNPMHLLAGANDYRTVDLPGLADDKMTGDAWLGVFTSSDGGATWRSTLLPGYPQEASSTSPLHGYDAGADPVVRAGPHGLIYYAGIVFDRDNPVLEARARTAGHAATAGVGTSTSAVFVARHIDNNAKENGNPIAYLGTAVVASNDGQEVFLDKPWLAVDMPRRGAGTCTITQTLDGRTVTQTIPVGNVYVAYSQFSGKVSDGTTLGTLMFSRSTDCGATWSAPFAISGTSHINQGATIALDPRTGAVYVVWRRFAWPLRPSTPTEPDAILIARSVDRGATFSAPEVVQELQPFDQVTGGQQFRTNAYPTAGVDRFGRVLVAYTTRGGQQDGDARIVLTWARYPSRLRAHFKDDEDDGTEAARTGDDRPAWTTPRPVDPDTTRRGHQIMPSMLVTGLRVQIAWVDLQEDHTWGVFTPDPATGQYLEGRELSEERKNSPDHVFNAWISDGTVQYRRHSADLWIAQADPGDRLNFTARRASSYKAGARWDKPDTIQQLQFNPPNLPLFRLGTAAFWSDYIDLGAQPLEQKARLRWRHTLQPPSAHLVFTDNRDVRAPTNGDWSDYTPPRSAALKADSIFSPGTPTPTCSEAHPENAGMRNQNIYTARVSQGLYVVAPGNAKPLGQIQRAFVVYAENNTFEARTFRLSIASQPPGGSASFKQFERLTRLDVTIGARSSVSRTVYVRSTDPRALVTVDVREVSGGGVIIPPVQGGLQGTTALNPDSTNPDMMNPDMMNPDMMNPDVLSAEIYTPDMMNPDMMNPDMMNPDMMNPDMMNPDMMNPDMMNPDMMNPDMMNPDMMNLTPGSDVNATVLNPDMMNPDMMNADPTSAALTDTVWTLTNNGNTTAAYDVKMLLRGPSEVPDGFKTQLLLYKTYLTPVARDCELTQERQNVLIASVPNPPFGHVGDSVLFNPADGSLGHTTLWLAPGETGKVTLRVLDPDRTDAETFDPVTEVAPAVAPQSVDTESAAAGVTTPEIVTTSPIVLVARPTATPIGGFVTPPAQVLVQDESGAPIAGAAVTLSLAANPGGATLHGGAATTGSDGIATFGQLWLDRLGSGYRLRATTGGRTSDDSGPFDVVPLVVTTGADAGAGSLRAAIENANRNAGYPDTISFDIDGGGVHTIAPVASLPSVTDALTIDGTTQPGYAGTPVIELNGLSAGNTPGLVITGGGSTVRGLAIGGFSFEAIRLAGGSGNVIQGNFIGTDATGDSARPNNEGILVAGSSNNRIGGASVAERNVISGNLATGINISSSLATGNEVLGNFIGTDATGTAALGNGQFGVFISDASGNTVGGAASGAGNLISGNAGVGVGLFAGANSNLVEGNLVGTTTDGMAALGNAGGVGIEGSLSNPTSGVTVRGNVVSGNKGDGVMLGSSTTGGYVTTCRIEGNKIGTNVLGAGASGVSNLGNGVMLRGHSTSDNLIQDNVISGNGADGLHLRDNTHHNTILGNRIGTDAAGTASLGNGQNGVRLDGTDHNTFGSPGKGNVVSGNAQNGIHLREAVAELVQGNRVGTNAAGSAAIPNGSAGVALSASAGGNTIGGALPGEGNVISGNRGVGVDIANSPGNQLSGNWIGTSDTRAQLGNGGNGVTLSGASLANIIGGLSDGSGNTIAFNTGSGVKDAAGATGTQILGNSIFSNGLEGLVGNGLQNSPILTSANTSGGTTTVSGSLSQFDSPSSFFRIEFFRSASCDGSGSGEGEQLMGRAEVTTDGTGIAPFSVPFAAISGGVVTATATSPAIGTSGFSACLVPDLASVVADIRTIMQAEAAYQPNAAGWYGTLDCLATPSGCISGYPPTGPAFLSPDLASLAPRAGYARAFSAGPGVSSPFLLVPGLTRWAYTAVPESGFGPAFCAQPDGGIFVRDDGVASAADGECTSGGTPLP